MDEEMAQLMQQYNSFTGGLGAGSTAEDDLFDDSFIEPAVQEYMDFFDEEDQVRTGFVTLKYIDEHLQELGDIINQFIVYPDLFIDLITPHSSHFSLTPYQRITIRIMERKTTTYLTFSRGTSKSFLADLDRYLHCMFVPRHNTTITAGSNKQAAQIAKQKILDDLWVKFPFLANEMQRRKIAGKILDAYNTGKDYVEFNFRNGSSLGLGNVRGLRRQSIIFEEVIEQDEVKVNEQYIPLLNEPRKMSNGLINPYEPQSQQIYITTAGYQGTFAYQKLIEVMCRSVIEPEKYCALLATYKLPLYHGLTAKQQIDDIINSPSFSKSSFEREYLSVWSNSPVGAAFSSNIITSLRQVKMVEFKNKLTTAQKEQGCFYVVCADMAKDGSADTAVGVAKVIPKENYFTYKFVNLFEISSTDYMVVANTFKKTVMAYDARLLIYDANGVGAGIRDWLNKQTTDEQGMILEGYGIINPPSSSEKDLIRYPKHKTLCYEIKSGGTVGEQIHFFFFSRMSTGAITFPIKFSEAVSLYTKNKTFIAQSSRKQQDFLSPFKKMDKAEEELKNLDIAATSDQMSNRLKVVRRSTAFQKDYFSMMEYLVWAVSQSIELPYYKSKRNRGGNANKIRKISFL